MSEKILDIVKQFEEGFPIFEKLFNLNSVELKNKLKEICGEEFSADNLFSESSHVTKTIVNDRPQEVVVDFYDTISISPIGINYQPEHGESRKIVSFNKFFVLS
jgi:hypothetical protein